MNSKFAFHVQRYFASYLIKQHNYGSNTIASYRDTFRLLLKFMGHLGRKSDSITVVEINKESVTGFLEWLETDRHNSVASKNVRLAHLKSFFRYVMLNVPEFADHCSTILSIPFEKTVKKPPKSLSVDAIGKLLHSIDATTDVGLRHLAIITLLYDAGCRVQELIELNVSDFQNQNCYRVYVHGKGDKYRAIPLLRESGKILSKYIQRYKLSSNSILFMNTNGDRLTRQGVRYIVNKYAEITNHNEPNTINDSIYPHQLRHSKASHLVSEGVNIYNVRDFLGHESVVTTQIYLTSNPEIMREAIENASAKIVPNSLSYYSDKQKSDLMTFLNNLG